MDRDSLIEDLKKVRKVANLVTETQPVWSARLTRVCNAAEQKSIAIRDLIEGRISIGKFAEIIGVKLEDLHEFKRACGAFD